MIICLEHTNFVHMLRNDCPFQVESGSLLYCLRLVSVFNVVIQYLSFSTIIGLLLKAPRCKKYCKEHIFSLCSFFYHSYGDLNSIREMGFSHCHERSFWNILLRFLWLIGIYSVTYIFRPTVHNPVLEISDFLICFKVTIYNIHDYGQSSDILLMSDIRSKAIFASRQFKFLSNLPGPCTDIHYQRWQSEFATYF